MPPQSSKKAPWMHKGDLQRGDVFMTREDSLPDDIVVPVMGSTGVGKSTFINNCLTALTSDKGRAPVATGFSACTSKMGHYIVKIPPNFPSAPKAQGRRLVLLDTPGFDHLDLTNAEILRRIAVWLAMAYGNGVKVAGVIYLHPISPGRMSQGHSLGLSLFRTLCGKEALSGVVLGTTFWGMESQSVEDSRHAELEHKFWKDMLTGVPRGTLVRIDNTPRSALEALVVVLKSLRGDGHALRIQKQVVDDNVAIKHTDAGKLADKPAGDEVLRAAIARLKSFLRFH